MGIVVLSGFMGTGKSTLGPLVAERLGVPFVDTDAEIARRCDASVGEVWRAKGEGDFRLLEAEIAREHLERGVPAVLAFGGGTVTTRAIRHLALDRAFVVTLDAAPAAVLARIGDLSSRPALLSRDPLARIAALMEQRRAAYAECHLTIRTDQLSLEESLTRILALVSRARVVVPLGLSTYPVDIVHDAPEALAAHLDALAPSSLLVVADENVETARGAALALALERSALAPERITRVTLTPGESHKTLAAVEALWDRALTAKVDRHAVVLGFGGGVVGDLAGFAASTLLRGLRTVLVPTTLLAMADASVGGKTGFDRAQGKNLVGSFHQPSAVVVDLAHLSTLPQRELIAGLAEVAKIALACDEELWLLLESCAEELRDGSLERLAPVLTASIRLKARVVRDDELETGRRKVLNLGHTVGHALEAASGYSRLHGEAVSLGMAVELHAWERLGRTPKGLSSRVRSLLGRLGLQTVLTNSELGGIWGYMESDKKRLRTTLELPVVERIGVTSVEVVQLRDWRDAVGALALE